MKITLDYENDQILIGDQPLGIALSDAKADVVFSGDNGAGLLRLFVGADDFAIVPKKPVAGTPVEPDLMEQLSPQDAFEVEMEKIRRGAGRG